MELRKNLIYIGKEDEFIKYSSNATMKYSIVALIASLIAGPLFNINNYLPMYISIISACLCFYFSFYLFDVTELDKNYKEPLKENKKINKHNISSFFFLILFIAFALETGIIDIGPSESKLFIQSTLEGEVNIKLTSLILSISISFFHIVAIFSNIIFPKIYKKIKDKSGYLLSALLIFSFILLLIGYFIDAPLILKITIMVLGFILIGVVKGPYTVYLEDLILKNGKTGTEQELAAYINLVRNIGGAGISAIASIILIYHSLNYVIYMLLLSSIAELYLFHKIRKLKNENKKY